MLRKCVAAVNIVVMSVLLLVCGASAQNYPVKPLRIVTSGVGGSNDFIARMLASAMSGLLGQNVIVDNRPSGVIPGETVAKSLYGICTILTPAMVLNNSKVRGTRYNTGDGIRMALEIGAQPYGQWSGCHATSWERYASDFGDPNAQTRGHRNCYQFSVMVNSEGKRFLDEGADFRNYTYAKYGRIVLQQPGSCAWQIFDAQVAPLRRDDYSRKGATKVQADTLEELVAKMPDVDSAQLLRTLRDYNAAVRREVPFNPTAKDGRCTTGLAIPKSNWANPIEVPPFEAYAVGTGITFTFGGLKIDTRTRALDMADTPLPGLYAAGELVGGIFYFNYPGGSGLMSGAVFGRIAGREAANFALAAR